MKSREADEFHIAETCTDSLVRLTSVEQKAVCSFQFAVLFGSHAMRFYASRKSNQPPVGIHGLWRFAGPTFPRPSHDARAACDQPPSNLAISRLPGLSLHMPRTTKTYRRYLASRLREALPFDGPTTPKPN